ncbi:MAG: nucleotidyltransferase domain-containing protein [Pseudomonadota bacterium]
MSGPILIKKKRSDPLKGKNKAEFEKELAGILQKKEPKVLAAYIFGSFTSANFNEDSDVDLIIVGDFTKDFFHRVEDFPEIYNLAGEIGCSLLYSSRVY